MSFTDAHRAKAAAKRRKSAEERAQAADQVTDQGADQDKRAAMSSGHLTGTLSQLPPEPDKGRYVTSLRSSKAPGRINLRAVAEVLAARGLDPTEELVDILESGRLDVDVRARVLNELLQYTQPKLKSVEIRAKVAATSFDVNDEQAKKIAEEFLKSGGV